MRKSAIDHMVMIAKDDDYLEFITTICRPICIKKRLLHYTYFDYCIRLNDDGAKEKYMIQLDTIEAVKIIEPKF